MHAGGTISKYYEYILITETYFSLLSSMVKGFFTNVGSDSLTSYTRTYLIPFTSKLVSFHVLWDKYELVHGMY